MPRTPPSHLWMFEIETPISNDEALEIGDLGNELDQKEQEPKAVHEEKKNERNNQERQ